MVREALAIEAWKVPSSDDHADERTEQVGTRPHLDRDVSVVLGDEMSSNYRTK